MGRSFVVNASPLILLSRIGRLDLLSSLADVTVVPQRVLDELEAGSKRDEAAEIVRASEVLDVVPDVEIPEQLKLWDLGPGESQVLARALSKEGHEARQTPGPVGDNRAATDYGTPLGAIR